MEYAAKFANNLLLAKSDLFLTPLFFAAAPTDCLPYSSLLSSTLFYVDFPQFLLLLCLFSSPLLLLGVLTCGHLHY